MGAQDQIGEQPNEGMVGQKRRSARRRRDRCRRRSRVAAENGKPLPHAVIAQGGGPGCLRTPFDYGRAQALVGL